MSVFLKFSKIVFVFGFFKYVLCGCLIDNEAVVVLRIEVYFKIFLSTLQFKAALLVTMCVYIFIHLVVCLTTGPKPLLNRALHIVRSRASSFKCEYPLLSLRPSISFLCFLPRIPITSILPFIFPSITRCRRQFLRKM